MGKYDYARMDDYGTIIDDVPWWKMNVPPHNHNGYIFPKPFNKSYSHHHWQLQMWSLFRREFMHDNQLDDVLRNKMVNKTQDLRSIDILFFEYGLHDYGWFQDGDRGLKFYNALVKTDFVEKRKHSPMPTIWLPMNTNCKEKIDNVFNDRDQAGMVADGNKYVNKQLLADKIPYFDTVIYLMMVFMFINM